MSLAGQTLLGVLQTTLAPAPGSPCSEPHLAAVPPTPPRHPRSTPRPKPTGETRLPVCQFCVAPRCCGTLTTALCAACLGRCGLLDNTGLFSEHFLLLSYVCPTPPSQPKSLNRFPRVSSGCWEDVHAGSGAQPFPVQRGESASSVHRGRLAGNATGLKHFLGSA